MRRRDSSGVCPGCRVGLRLGWWKLPSAVPGAGLRGALFLLLGEFTWPASQGSSEVKILLVEDDSSCRIATAMVLEYLGHSVEAVASGDEALAHFDQGLHQIVVTDLVMPGLSGRELAAELKRRSPATPIVVYSGAVEATREGVDALITKPASIAQFQETLASVVISNLSNSACRPRNSAERLVVCAQPVNVRPRMPPRAPLFASCRPPREH